MASSAAPHDAATRSNDDWVRALASDGPEAELAQRELRAILVRGLRRMLAARGVPDDLCEDFAHDALVKIRARLATFRGESRFSTWALAIATRVAFDELRHARWRDTSFEALTADAHGPIAFEAAGHAGTDRALMRAKVVEALREVIDLQLTDKQRAVLVAELRGMPHAEIAVALHMNRNALYKLSHDARQRVKLHLEAAGLSAADVRWVFE